MRVFTKENLKEIMNETSDSNIEDVAVQGYVWISKYFDWKF